MSFSDLSFWNAVEALRDRDPRYRREAYGFVVGALSMTVQGLPADRRRDPERRHLSGRELLEGLVAIAQREFGPLASVVFSEWGLRSSEDVGRIVFDLVDAGQLSARPEDTIDDFRGGPDLHKALTDRDNAAARGR